MKTSIKRLSLRGFKSFNKKVELVFQPGLNTVIGPNGSGKSNVGDAICFVLGRRSSKDLRAENYADLLFKRKNTVASEGEVSIVLDNSSKIFPVPEAEVELKRRIKKDGQTQFKINGKTVTRQQVLELLSAARIHPDGHNIILQGDIARFVDLKPLERRYLIEEIAGISVYEERKNKALLELGKVEERLKEVNIVLREKEIFMKNLEEEKKGAEKYRELQNNLKELQAGELALKHRYASEKRDKVAGEIETRVLNLGNIKLELDISGKKIAQYEQDLHKLEKDIQKKGGEDSLQLQKQVESVKIELEKARTLIATSLNEIERVHKRKSDLDNSLSELKQKLKSAGEEKKRLETELSAVEKQENAIKKGSASDLKALEQDFERFEKSIETLKSRREKLSSLTHELKAKIQVHESELKLINDRLSQIKSTTKDFSQAKQQQDVLAEKISELAKEDSKLALEIGELRKDLIKKEEQLTKNRILARGSQEALLRDSALRLLKTSAVKGVLGTVSELGQVKPQYATALSVAAGNRMKNVVVTDVETGIKCLQMLKNGRAGVATFLPLDKLRVFEDNVPASFLKKDGVLGLAHELIECDSKYRRVFEYVFHNTLIVQNVDIARSLGVGKYRMVTLDGDLFEPSGAITGGFRTTIVTFETVSNELVEKLELEVGKLNEHVSKLDKQRADLDEKIFELRKQKAEVDAKAELSDKGSFAKTSIDLNKRIVTIDDNLKKFHDLLKEAEDEAAKLEEQIVEKVSERNAANLELKELQFGTSAEKAEEISRRKSELEAQLAAINATITNGLLPEQNNTDKVLKELEKEKKSFEKQIADEEAKVKQNEKALEAKEKEQESFHSKLKALFEEQSGMSNNLRETASDYNKFLIDQSRLETEKNNFAIERAQHEGELAAVEEELKQFSGITPKEAKTLEDAKKKMHEMQAKLDALGNVNMRALEVFEDVIREHNELMVRVSKLSEEKNSVLQIIEEVEKRKREAFMKTFDDINGHFSNIYAKINAKYGGILVLENEVDPFAGGIAVSLHDTKRKRASLASLSGGEKTLLALAFIFAIQEHEPASFYMLDEIDAALDKLNSEKVAKLLKEYAGRAQVVIISHNDSVISESESLYGVSMNKEFESAVVSLKI
ncbi:MAG TPA: chromosome segregation protein SMC [Candidatus Nanoarchaeia archaeon]|nr:chromosome segregation protein SMC [Candidatus Nanoarchaeia archaeon]